MGSRLSRRRFYLFTDHFGAVAVESSTRRHQPDLRIHGATASGACLYAAGINTLLFHEVGFGVDGALRSQLLGSRLFRISIADNDRLCASIALQAKSNLIKNRLRGIVNARAVLFECDLIELAGFR